MERTVRNSEDLKDLYFHLGNMIQPFRVVVSKGEPNRTSQMNRLLHRWFSEIAAHRQDVSPAEIKSEMNLRYGVPIKRRDDPAWASAFGYIFDALSYPAKMKALRVLDIPITRDMTVKQLLEFMDQMERDERGNGVILTDPEQLRNAA